MTHGGPGKERSMHEEVEVFCAKGRSRRIVVVPAEDHPLYEQVIYVVKDGAAAEGVTAQEVLHEAQRCLRQPQEPYVPGEPLPDPEELEEADRVSKVLFALSGIALALSSGILVYWFFAV